MPNQDIPLQTACITVSLFVACKSTGKTDPATTADTIPKKDTVFPKAKHHTIRKIDTTTVVLLDTAIEGQTIKISRKGDSVQDNLDFSVAGIRRRVPQGVHRSAELYPGVINIADPTLTNDKISWKDGVLMTTFDRIFSQGELYVMRSGKDSLEPLTSGSGESIISYNGSFFVDPVRKQVVCFAPVDPDEKLIPLMVFSIGEHSFGYIGTFKVDTQEYYDVRKPVVIKAYLKWARRR